MQLIDALIGRARLGDAGAPSVEGGDDGPAHADEEPTGRGDERSAWSDRLPSNAVATAISDREDVGVEALPPLFDSIDPDGLDAVLRTAPEARVTFPHDRYEVTVTGRGEVALTRIEER